MIGSRLRGEADSPAGKEVKEMTSGQLVSGVWCLVAIILMTMDIQRYRKVPPAVVMEGCLQFAVSLLQ